MTAKTANASTKICLEEANPSNSYQAQKLYLSGYDLEDIADNGSLVDVLFLLFNGELPKDITDSKLLETLMIYLSLPSPRHPGAKAAMNSGVCKTNTEHLLPISLMAIGGEQSGAKEVTACYQFITNNYAEPANTIANKIIKNWHERDKHIAPGFGQHFGNIDPLSASFFKRLYAIKPNSKTLKWTMELLQHLKPLNIGILDVGVAACIFHDLSLGERESTGLYQYLRAPGLLAYATEQTHKPVSAIPMLSDSQYELIEND